MKISAPSLMVLALAATFGDAIAADWKPLDGTYAITARNYLDPSDEEPKDSHLRFQLAGDAARDMYLAMKVEEIRDECTGATSKRVGPMQCLYDAGEMKHACHFSIDVMRQTIEYGISC